MDYQKLRIETLELANELSGLIQALEQDQLTLEPQSREHTVSTYAQRMLASLQEAMVDIARSTRRRQRDPLAQSLTALHRWRAPGIAQDESFFDYINDALPSNDHQEQWREFQYRFFKYKKDLAQQLI
jgi:hypothetical protein